METTGTHNITEGAVKGEVPLFGKPLHHIAYASIRITLVHHITGECTVKGPAGKEGCHSYSKGRGNMGGVEEYTYQREGGGRR